MWGIIWILNRNLHSSNSSRKIGTSSHRSLLTCRELLVMFLRCRLGNAKSSQRWETLDVGSACARACMTSADSAKASIWQDRRRMGASGMKSDAIPVIRVSRGERDRERGRGRRDSGGGVHGREGSNTRGGRSSRMVACSSGLTSPQGHGERRRCRDRVTVGEGERERETALGRDGR
jgi:hypothetical protein